MGAHVQHGQCRLSRVASLSGLLIVYHVTRVFLVAQPHVGCCVLFWSFRRESTLCLPVIYFVATLQGCESVHSRGSIWPCRCRLPGAAEPVNGGASPRASRTRNGATSIHCTAGRCVCHRCHASQCSLAHLDALCQRRYRERSICLRRCVLGGWDHVGSKSLQWFVSQGVFKPCAAAFEGVSFTTVSCLLRATHCSRKLGVRFRPFTEGCRLQLGDTWGMD